MTFDEIIEDLMWQVQMTRLQQLGDYAPLHATLDFLSDVLEEQGRAFNDNRGWPKLLLLILKEAKGTDGFGAGIDLLENDPWLPCYKCGKEVKPALDRKLVDSYIKTTLNRSQRHEFYCCNDCGGDVTEISIRDEGNQRENWLPWEHEEFKYDFDFPR